MDSILNQLPNLTAHFGHIMVFVVFGVLLLSGFGLPVPEDIPLLIAGYLCYKDVISIWIMIPMMFVAVLGADCTLWYLGWRYGHHIPRWPMLKKYLTESRRQKAELAFHNHGGKTLFIARFLPGLRAGVYFTAGVFKIPFWKMLAFDGAAAAISVPAWVLLSWYFGSDLDKIKLISHDAKIVIGVTAVLLVVAFITWKVLRRRKVASQT